MGLVASRLNLGSLHSNGRRRSQQGEEQLYSYSLNKNYFSNYFLMGGERFEVSDPDYLFGDSSDLNFLTCTKPYSLPYKKAQQNLITNLNTKQKAINKVSSRVSSLGSPLNILSGRHRQVSQSRKQDAQTQTLSNSKSQSDRPEPSQPLVMLINIRKETLRLVKSPHPCNLDSDQNSLTCTVSEQSPQQPSYSQKIHQPTSNKHFYSRMQKSNSTNRYSTTSSHATTIHPHGSSDGVGHENIELEQTVYGSKNYPDSDTSSIASNTFSSRSTTTASSTGKSGYTSVRDVPPSECATDEDGEYFEDALNEPTNLSTDNDSEKNQQKSLLTTAESTKETCDIKINIVGEDEVDRSLACDIGRSPFTVDDRDHDDVRTSANVIKTKAKKILTKARNRKTPKKSTEGELSIAEQQASNRVYNIEFTFDAEVDCSIRVSYFCTRVVSTNNITYKPLHATYKSKTYTYKRGLNQKFEQQEHSFRPYLFDEDLLIYKPLDLDGNYNSGAVFPIVIHCIALEGPMPRQSQSLVATVEKSQLDDSYSIKPLKQMIFVDGVQYILQDIYGIENKPMTSSATTRRNRRPDRNLHSSCGSLHSLNNLRNSNINMSDAASIGSVLDVGNVASFGDSNRQGSLVSNQYRSLASENTFECVICMSDERDTMLLPCRHMCLCSSCAQSLRYQSNACPICRCPFKAALNIRFTRRSSSNTDRKWSTNITGDTENKVPTTNTVGTADASVTGENKRNHEEAARRESLTSSATPLLTRSKLVKGAKEVPTATNPHDTPDRSGAPPVVSLRSGRSDTGPVEARDIATQAHANLKLRSVSDDSGQKGVQRATGLGNVERENIVPSRRNSNHSSAPENL